MKIKIGSEVLYCRSKSSFHNDIGNPQAKGVVEIIDNATIAVRDKELRTLITIGKSKIGKTGYVYQNYFIKSL